MAFKICAIVRHKCGTQTVLKRCHIQNGIYGNYFMLYKKKIFLRGWQMMNNFRLKHVLNICIIIVGFENKCFNISLSCLLWGVHMINRQRQAGRAEQGVSIGLSRGSFYGSLIISTHETAGYMKVK